MLGDGTPPHACVGKAKVPILFDACRNKIKIEMKCKHVCQRTYVLNSKGISDSLPLAANLAETLDSKYGDFHVTKIDHPFVATTLDEVVAFKNDLGPFSKCPSSVNRVLDVKASGLHRVHGSIGIRTRVRLG